MAEINRAAEQSSYVYGGEKEASKNKIKARAVAALAAVAVGTTAFMNAAHANADVIVGAGGVGDPGAKGYEAQLHATGQIKPGDTFIPVHYPAGIAPIGDATLERSVIEGVINYHAAMDQAQRVAKPGEPIVSRGYSEGGIVIAEGARQRHGDVVQPGTVIIDSSPVSSTGVFNNPDPMVQQIINYAFQTFNIPTHYRAPAGSEVRGSEMDVWAYGSVGGPQELIPKAMATFTGPAHAVQNPHVPGARVWVGPDGIVQVQWPGMGTGGVPPMAFTMGGVGAVAPAPEARPAPKSPNFTAVSREWKRNHPEEYPEFAAEEAAKEAKKEAKKNGQSSATNGSMISSTRQVSSGSRGSKKNEQTTSYSEKFEPPVKAPQTRLNK